MPRNFEKTMKDTIQLVIFDCDGVLIDSEIISAQMLQVEAKTFGLDIPMDYILTHYVGRSYPKVLTDIQSQFAITLPDNFETLYRNRLIEALTAELQPTLHIAEVLSALNVPFCVATSSTPQRLAHSLAITGLARFFHHDNTYTASLVKNGKPAPDLFLLAAERQGVAAANCLVIEDSLFGIQAGLAAAMTTVRFTGGSHIVDKTAAAGATWVFDDFSRFFKHFPQLHRMS